MSFLRPGDQERSNSLSVGKTAEVQLPRPTRSKMAVAQLNDQAVISTAIDFTIRAHAVFLMEGVHCDRTNRSGYMSKKEEREFLARDPANHVRSAITRSSGSSLVAKAGVSAAALGATTIAAVGAPIALPIAGILFFAGTSQALRLRSFNSGPGKQLQLRFETELRRYLAERNLGLDHLFDMRMRDFESLRHLVGCDGAQARLAFMRAFAVNRRLRLDYGCRETARTPDGISAIDAAIAVLEVAAREPVFATASHPALAPSPAGYVAVSAPKPLALPAS